MESVAETSGSFKKRVLYERTCDSGDAEGCNNLGVLYAKGEGGPRDDLKARVALQRACDGGFAMGCAHLGLMYSKGRGGTRDDSKARAAYKRACDGRYASSCGLLGLMYEKGVGGPRDRSVAKALYKNACDDGFTIACASLAAMHGDGHRAEVLWKRACEGGNCPVCCNNLASMYVRVGPKNGSPGLARLLKACDLYKQVCDGGDALACSHLLEVKSMIATVTAAARLDCDDGKARTCTALGTVYENKGEDSKARSFYLRGCRGGDNQGCERLKTTESLVKKRE